MTLYIRNGRPSHFYNAKLLVFGLGITRLRWWW